MQRIDLQEIQARLDANRPPQSESINAMQKFTAATLPPKHPLWVLWSRFSEMYGHQWASQQGDEPNDTWVRGLSDITPEQFGAGLRALLNRKDTWPPNLVEFRQLCTGYDPDAWKRRAYKPYAPALPESPTAKQQRQADGLARIRALRESLEL